MSQCIIFDTLYLMRYSTLSDQLRTVRRRKGLSQATLAAQKDAESLAPMLQEPRYANEAKLLQDFRTRFAEYRDLERRILDLAVQNTNLKAQRLAFGPAG